jgi:hypothetical protein
MLIVQCLLSLGLHGDDPGRPGHLELEVGVAEDGHELYIARSSQDDVIRPGEVDHLKCKRFGVVVAHASKSD